MNQNKQHILEEIYGRQVKELTFAKLSNKPIRQRSLTNYFHYASPKHATDLLSRLRGKPDDPNKVWFSDFRTSKFDVDYCAPHDFESAEQALDYAIDFCEVVMDRKMSTRHTITYYLMRRDLPYTFDFALCNRDYNPVGSNYGSKFSTWEEWPHLSTRGWKRPPRDLTGRTGRDVFNSRKVTGYLFYDGNAPWHGPTQLSSYRDRLLKLKDTINKGDENEVELSHSNQR